MKKNVLILIVLSVTASVSSQEFRIDVRDEPLNKVLRMLDIEISFDATALSTYMVSASHSFENPEKALLWLLEGKPLSIRKVGNVYVIFPNQQNRLPGTNMTYDMELLYFTGTVISSDTDDPLEYAVVTLLDNDGQTLITGLTSDRGQFCIQTKQTPAKIKISHLGYETLLTEIRKFQTDLGVFVLNDRVIELNEIVVATDNMRNGLNSTVYTITPKMSEGVNNALELLDHIPDVYVDKSSKSVRLNHNDNILLLIDGIQYHPTLLKYFSSKRVQAIEIVYSSSGRFVSDDHAGIIHFKLKKEYTGFDLNFSNTVSLNLSSKSKDNRLIQNQPSVGIIHSTNKITLFGMYEYDNENRNVHTSRYLTYGKNELDIIPSELPNYLYELENHLLSGGVHYRLTPRQLIGVKADFVSGRTNTFEEYMMKRTDPSNNYDRILTNTTKNGIEANTFVGTLFYQSQVSNRIHLSGDFLYNYYFNNINNNYVQDYSNYPYSDVWDEYKHLTALNLESKYFQSEKVSFDAGYSNIHRQYASNSSQGIGFLDYRENRNKAFVYLSGYSSDNTGLKAGIALEHIRQQNDEKISQYLRILPYLTVSYKMSRTVNIVAGYFTNQSYPALYQISPMNIVIDTFLTQIGNPELKSAVRHHAFIKFSLSEKLKIIPQLTFIRDGVSEIYDYKLYKLYRTFENVNMREYSLHASYDRMFGTYFRMKNSFCFYHSEAFRQEIRNKLNGYTFHSEVTYYQPDVAFGVQAGYFRNMKKDILWQGYQMSDKDYWCVSVRKEFWYSRLSVLLSYIPPVGLGVRYDKIKEMDTPLYKEKTVQNLESYNQMLQLKVNIRMDGGKGKNAEHRMERIDYERER